MSTQHTMLGSQQDTEGDYGFLDDLPPALKCVLLDFQKKGIAYGLQRKGRCLIGDEMGLGKTVQAIALAWLHRQHWPLLVVVPASMRYTWVDELEKWLPDLPPGSIKVARSGKDVGGLTSSSITISTYNLLQQAPFAEALRGAGFKAIIADESHYLKTRNAKRTEALLPLLQKAQFCVLLSGTPALARPEELYTQIEAVTPGLVGSFTSYSKRYCNAHRDRFGWNTKGASNLEELHGILLKSVMIRRLKDEVLTELPAKRRQRITIELPPAATKELGRQLRLLRDLLVGNGPEAVGGSEGRHKINALITDTYRQTAEAKMEAVLEYVHELVRGGVKFLLFGYHVSTVHALASALARSNVGHVCIMGETSPQDRHDAVKRFQNHPNVQVAVLSLKAAYCGLTLTAAHTVVFSELYWTPGVVLQAEDRVHRIGQRQAVNIQYLVAKGTLDEMLWRAFNKKVAIVGRTLNGTAEGLGAAEDDQGGGLGALIKECMQWEDGADTVHVGPKAKNIVAAPAVSKIQAMFARSAKRKQPPSDPWACAQCTYHNAPQRTTCEVCMLPRPADQSSPPSSQEAAKRPRMDIDHDVILLDHDVAPKGPDSTREEGVCDLQFSVSGHTGRLYVHGADGTYLKAHVHATDIRGDGTLPDILLQPGALQKARAFVDEWNALRAYQQAALANTVMRSPKEAAGQLAASSKASTNRYAARAEGASEGTCQHCGGVVDSANPGCLDLRFCTEECREGFDVKTSSQAIRRQLYALEKGVCQLCGVDAHLLYLEVARMAPHQRRAHLMTTKFAALSARQMDRLAEGAGEGFYWQADHIRPVAEGGGECDLSNLRTLCTPCHATETQRLAARLPNVRLQRASKGTRDIRGFFKAK